MRWGRRRVLRVPVSPWGAVWGDGLSGGYLPAGPDFSSSGIAAASLPFSQAGWGCLLFQSQKRGISNCPGKPEFCQRGQNSSRSDWRRLRSSDRPLGTAKFRFPGTVRNIRRFFLWISQHPHPLREERRPAAPALDGGKDGACADAFFRPTSTPPGGQACLTLVNMLQFVEHLT